MSLESTESCIIYYHCFDGKSLNSQNQLESSHCNENIQLAKYLFDYKIFRIFGNSNVDNIQVLTNRGICDIVTRNFLIDSIVNENNHDSHFQFNSLACGSKHFLAISQNDTDKRQLYAWGEGNFGELGLGASKVLMSSPMNLNIKDADIISISCGNSHSFVIEKNGNLYGFGQNFDKQLGLYSHEKNNDNFIHEEVIYKPRLVPICLKYPISKVSCGSDFTLCLTRTGKLFSWGASSCGQIGQGRQSNISIPRLVEFPNQEVIHDIAAGYLHSLVVTSDGSIYGFGMNKHGQLGLGHLDTMFIPRQNELLIQYKIIVKKVFCDMNSSACIDLHGCLYTWGSTNYGRLMHSYNETYIAQPIKVEYFHKSHIYDFAFAKASSAVLIKSIIYNIEPSLGPQKTFSQLQLFGDGLYDSKNIIIKFQNISLEYNRTSSRSCLGTYDESQSCIICKPPKLIGPGEHQISISMNGQDFLPQTISLFIYKDLMIVELLPHILDLREQDSFDLLIICKNISSTITYLDQQKLMIKLMITDLVTKQVNEVMIKGDLQDHLNEDNATISCHLDTNLLSNVSLSNGLLLVQAQISLNKQDFCPISLASSSLVCHTFDILQMTPEVYVKSSSLSLTSSSKLHLKCINLLPMSLLPRDCLLMSTLRLLDSEISTNFIPLAYEDSETLVMDSLAFHNTIQELFESRFIINMSLIEVDVLVGILDNTKVFTPLSTQTLKIPIYSPSSFSLTPKVWNKSMISSQLIELIVLGGLKHISSKALIKLYSNNYENELACLSDLEFIPMTQDQVDQVNDWKVRFRISDDVLVKLEDYETIMIDWLYDGLTGTKTLLEDTNRVYFYHHITIVKMLIPNKGLPGPNSPVSLLINGLPKGYVSESNTNTNISTNTIVFVPIIRLRGSLEGKFLDIRDNVKLNETTDGISLSFVLPPPIEMKTLTPCGKGKDKKLYLDISVDDGYSFCQSNEPNLSIK